MKLITLKSISAIVLTLLVINMGSNVYSISIKKVEDKTLKAEVQKATAQSETEKHKKHRQARIAQPAVSTAKPTASAAQSASSAAQPASPAVQSAVPATRNSTSDLTKISVSAYSDLNNTFSKQDLNTFKISNRKWDFKLLDKQLEDIFHDMNFKEEKDNTEEGKKNFLNIFVSKFEACDKDNDNVLNLNEFTDCLKSDSYLSTIQTPNTAQASYANYTTADGVAPILFGLFDSYKFNYTNLHDYMLLRLMAFSWSKCSVNAPFIDEVNFECAIEIAAGFKTLSRNTVRRLFSLGLELSNSETLRNMDFVTFVIVATTVRSYGKINGKEDSDITRNEFNLALDSNILPMRYNQEVVNNFFKLVEEYDRPNQGIDLISFVFYDFFLRIFDVQAPSKKYYLSNIEFQTTFSNYLFPNRTNSLISKIPQNALSNNAYQMSSYLNLTTYNSEADHFLKSFMETESTVHFENKNKFFAVNQGDVSTLSASNINLKFNANTTYTYLFNALDNDADGYLNFYDYGSFIQVAYLFTKFDNFKKGRIVAGELFERFSQYSDLPVASYHLRERAKRFNSIPQDLYFDVYSAVLVLKIDDIINTVVRRTDKTTIYEVELKNILNSVNLKFVPDSILNKCLRGTDANNTPLYDWECAFMQAVTKTLNYYETSYNYLTAKTQNITLTNTVFVNADPLLSSK